MTDDADPPLLIPYCRQSLGRPGETAETSLSLDSQEEAIRAWGERAGYRVERAVRDHDLSGADWHRPGIREVEARARPGVTVAVWRWDRFGRDAVGSALVARAIEAAGARVLSITQGSDKTARGIYGVIGEAERDRISEQVKLNRVNQARRGQFIGSQPPYGYRRASTRAVKTKESGTEDRPTGPLVPDEATAPIVAECFARVAAGESPYAIVRDLNARGVRTAKGRAWDETALRRVLRNPAYAGDVTHLGAVVAHEAHDALVERHTWQRVQDRLARQATLRRHPGGSQPVSWCAGLVLHACGHRMYTQPTRKPDGRCYPSFYCRTSFLAHRCAHGRRHVSVPMLEAAARACLVADLGAVVPLAEAIRHAELAAGGRTVLRQRATLEAKAAAIQHRRDRAREAWLAGVDPLDEWERSRADFDARISEVARELAALPAVPDPERFREAARTLGSFRDAIHAAGDEALGRVLADLGTVVVDEAGVRMRYRDVYRNFVPDPTITEPRRLPSLVA